MDALILRVQEAQEQCVEGRAPKIGALGDAGISCRHNAAMGSIVQLINIFLSVNVREQRVKYEYHLFPSK